MFIFAVNNDLLDDIPYKSIPASILHLIMKVYSFFICIDKVTDGIDNLILSLLLLTLHVLI